MDRSGQSNDTPTEQPITTTPETPSPVAPQPVTTTAPAVEPSAPTATAEPVTPVSPAPSVPLTPPVAYPQSQGTPQVAPARQVNAGLVVLQWLTYAFWGWTLLGLSFLVSMVFLSLLGGKDVGGATPYGIAATLVLLPISFICDSVYRKREPEHKAGAEVLVMVVHAVLFALFGIGALITSVFSAIQLITSTTGTTETISILISGLVIAVYYGLTFVRTLNPAKLRPVTRFYRYVMLVSIGIFAILGVVGPIAKERTLRNDKLVTSTLPSIADKINQYGNEQGKLPENLSVLELSDDAHQLIDKKLVTYKAETPETTTSTSDANNGSSKLKMMAPLPTTDTTSKTLKYQLCTTFTQKSQDDYYGSSSSYKDSEGYSDYLYIDRHDAGDVCYKLKATVYNQ